ncbi:MAG: hypothetical protein ACOC8H_00695 [bacterium]
MELSDILARLMETLGLKKSQADKYLAMDKKLRASRASNVDRLESLKEEIGALMRRIKSKKKEYDAATGEARRVVKGEIQRVFAELDRLKNREQIIGRNIGQLDLAVAKLAELQDARSQGVDTETLDDIAFELEDIVDELKMTDKAREDLDQVTYEPQKASEMDIEARVANLEGTGKETEPVSEELSESDMKRLKELADEDD